MKYILPILMVLSAVLAQAHGVIPLGKDLIPLLFIACGVTYSIVGILTWDETSEKALALLNEKE